jgi:hypothetical protein
MSELDNFIVIKKSTSDEAIYSHILDSFTFDETKSSVVEKHSSKSYLKIGMCIFASKEDKFYQWQKARIIEIINSESASQRVVVKFEKNDEFNKIFDDENDEVNELATNCIAFSDSISENYILPIRSRIVAMNRNENDKKSPFYSVGTVCELPNPRNQIFFLLFEIIRLIIN